MRILFAPFAARPPSLNGSPNPKDYPFARELAAELEERYELIQVGGNGDERVAKDFRANLSFNGVGELIKSSDTGICCDSYLQHHYWLMNKKAIVLWGISDPVIFGHDLHINLLKDRRFLRPKQFDLYYGDQYNPQAFVTPLEVLHALEKI